MTDHRAILEATNAGHYFAECTCGWSGGVFYGKATAREAHRAHVVGGTGPQPVKPGIALARAHRTTEGDQS